MRHKMNMRELSGIARYVRSGCRIFPLQDLPFIRTEMTCDPLDLRRGPWQRRVFCIRGDAVSDEQQPSYSHLHRNPGCSKDPQGTRADDRCVFDPVVQLWLRDQESFEVQIVEAAIRHYKNTRISLQRTHRRPNQHL